MKVDYHSALKLLKNGGNCAVPTETVYGLAARFDDEAAIKNIFELKGRPLNNPLIVHIGSLDMLRSLVKRCPKYVDDLIQGFWPGPLTLVLDKSDLVSNLITANQSTVAIRMPAHKLLRDLIVDLGVPIVAPSANRYCQTSPTEVAHVEKSLGEEVAILDGGTCSVGIESTIVLANADDHMTLLRPGVISIQDLADIAGVQCHDKGDSSVKAPGNHHKHYQPEVPLFTFSSIEEIEQYLGDSTNRLGVLHLSKSHYLDSHFYMEMPNDPNEYARMMYKIWWSMGQHNVSQILVEMPPEKPHWAGVRDRLIKASSKE
tara:strand:- start:43 stop:990 length:948 start_codon:yes stop_codon:yes gene_type:complete